MKTLVLGGCSIDTLIHVDEIKSVSDDMMLWANNVVESVGGTGAGKALCLDSLGHDVTWLTDLGKDDYGEKILNRFSKTNVNLIPLEVDKSTAHTNIMHSKGKRISIFTSTPSVKPKILNEINDLVNLTDVIFLNINDFCRDYIPLIKDKGKPIIVDIHDYDPPNPYHQDFIDIADILTVSGVYIDDHKLFLEEMIAKGKKIVIITKGNEGLIAMDKLGNIYELSGYNDFEYIDSNGAGDSFCAAFGTEYIKSNNIGESLKYATICGGIACTSYDLFNTDYNEKKIKEIKKRVDF